jgi:hypothetical protein
LGSSKGGLEPATQSCFFVVEQLKDNMAIP